MTTGRRAGGKMLNSTNDRIEELRQRGLACVRENRLDEALALYDEALTLSDDDEISELIRINKADALISLERGGPEVLELPRVIMRRRNPRHVFLAAYALQYKNRLENELKRALFYGELALGAAAETGDLLYQRAALVDLGNVYEMDSQIDKAVDCFVRALEMIDAADPAQHLSLGYTLENLGYCRLLQGDTDTGITTIHRALEYLHDPLGLGEAYIDLCYGYLEQENLDKAAFYGEAGLEVAADQRQIRNAHYLLGEVAHKAGDTDKAHYHFDELAKFYPQFRNLKSLLFAIDLRSMVNLKL
jgi:tetratricopeptide (TPR) repeat protein